MRRDHTVRRWLMVGIAAAAVLGGGTFEAQARRYFVGGRGELATLRGESARIFTIGWPMVSKPASS